MLLHKYHLKFILVADALNYTRTVEEIKLRYYSVAKAVLKGRQVEYHPIIQTPYCYEYDLKRKANMERAFL